MKTTTRQRIDLLARAYPRLFPRAELLRLVRTQLGHVDALDRWFERDGTRVRARAPKSILHICAGNLAVSAWTSIAHGLILGAQNVVKLPSDRDDSSTRREILDFIRGLPAPLLDMVKTQRTHDPKAIGHADVVVAFGSDATMSTLRAQTRIGQKFIAHGHAVSLLWMDDPNALTVRQARACATDVLTYDQLGCLSPQAIYLPLQRVNFAALMKKLSSALEAQWQRTHPKPGRTLGIAARIAEARDLAHAAGQRVVVPPSQHLGWTLILATPDFQPSPLHGVIYLRQATEENLAAVLAPVADRISTVGVVGKISSPLQEAFLSLGVSRFCPAGRMQFPPLTWHHDGRATLGEWVTWVDSESPA